MYGKISPKMVNPRAIAGNTKEEYSFVCCIEPTASQCNKISSDSDCVAAGAAGIATETEVGSGEGVAHLAAGAGQCWQDHAAQTAGLRGRQSHHPHTGDHRGTRVRFC